MPDNTFDIVSKIDLQEVTNAINQAMKEVTGPIIATALLIPERKGAPLE